MDFFDSGQRDIAIRRRGIGRSASGYYSRSPLDAGGDQARARPDPLRHDYCGQYRGGVSSAAHWPLSARSVQRGKSQCNAGGKTHHALFYHHDRRPVYYYLRTLDFFGPTHASWLYSGRLLRCYLGRLDTEIGDFLFIEKDLKEGCAVPIDEAAIRIHKLPIE